MANNKIVLGNETLIDLTEDTVTEDTLLEGETAHDASGNQITGKAKTGVELKPATKTTLGGVMMPEDDSIKVDKNGVIYGTKVEIKDTLTTGTRVANIKINGESNVIYVPDAVKEELVYQSRDGYVKSYNLFDINAIEDGYIDTRGVELNVEGYKRSGYIEVDPNLYGHIYLLCGHTEKPITIYQYYQDKRVETFDTFNSLDGIKKLYVFDNIKYVRFTGEDLPTDLQFGLVISDKVFQPYDNGKSNRVLTTEFEEAKGELSTLESNVTTNTEAIEQVNERLSDNADYLKSKNFINKKDFATNRPFHLAGGGLANPSSTVSVGNVEVQENTTYTVSDSELDSSTYIRISYLTSGGAFISREGAFQTHSKTFTTPPSCGLVELAVDVQKVETLQLEEGTTATPYVPFAESNVELTAKLSEVEIDVAYGANLVGNETNVYYPCKLKKGDVITIAHNAQSSESASFRVYFADGSKKEVDSWNIRPIDVPRTITIEADSEYIYLPNIPSDMTKIQINRGNKFNGYQEYRQNNPLVNSKGLEQITEEIAIMGKIHYLDHTYKFSVDSKGLVILNYPSSLIGKHVFSIFTTKSDGDPCNNIALYEPDVQSSSKFVCYGEANKSYNSYTFRFAYFD